MKSKSEVEKRYELSTEITNNLIYSGKPFTLEENAERIAEEQKRIFGDAKGFFGMIRLAQGFGLNEYYNELIEDKIINLYFDKRGNPYYQLNPNLN